MSKSLLRHVLPTLLWFGFASAIIIDGLIGAAEIEPQLEEMRIHNAQHPPEEAYWICWWPRINFVWTLPFITAGIFSIAGMWKVGAIIGASTAVILADQLWFGFLRF